MLFQKGRRILHQKDLTAETRLYSFSLKFTIAMEFII